MGRNVVVARAKRVTSPLPMIKVWRPIDAQICNKINTLNGSIEIEREAALYYLRNGVSLYPKRHFPNNKIVRLKDFHGGSVP